jgi:hypothetical protein
MVLVNAWDLSALLGPSEAESGTELSQAFILSRINTRSRKSLERLYKALPSEVLEVLVLQWHDTDSAGDSDTAAQLARLSTLIDLLTPSAQKVLAASCDLINIRSKVPPSSNTNPDLSEAAIFSFMESYVGRLEGPIAVQVWSTLLAFARDVLASTALAAKFHLLPTLRLVTMVGCKIAQTSALEDRRLRRDLQDAFTKLLDSTLAHGGRTGQGLRKVGSDASLSSSVLAESSLVNGDAKSDSPNLHQLAVSNAPASSAITVHTSPAFAELCNFLASHVLPNLKRFLLDNDKIASICSSILQTCLAPSFNKRTKCAFRISLALC